MGKISVSAPAAAAPTQPTTPTKAAEPTTAAATGDWSFITDSPGIGPVGAKAVLVEFSDFQCPYCAIAYGREFGGAQFSDERGTATKFTDEYAKTGKARFVYHPVAFFGRESADAANAAYCAREVGGDEGFFKMHDKLFENQQGENRGAFAIDNLKRFAQEIGLDTQTFNQCSDSHKYEALVKAETREALDKGLATRLIEPYVSYYELPSTGYRRDRFLLNNPEFAKVLGLKVSEKVPSERYDELLEMEERTPEQEFEMDAYKMFVPDELVPDYVGYKTLPSGTYEDDWWMMEHPDFYKEVYLGILGNQRKDYRKVPSRVVGTKYLKYQALTYGVDRDKYRLDNPDLDEWGVLAGIWTTTMSEKRRRLGITPQERLEEDVQKMIERIEGVGVR